LTGVFAIFTPYPSIADAALYLSLVPLFRHLFPRKYPTPATIILTTDPS
jgi:phosphatidylinositol glycan class U